MTDQPIDDDMSGLDPDRLRILAEVSNEFAQARRMMAAIAAGDTDAMTRIALEVAAGDPVRAFLAACTEAVQAARELYGDVAEGVLARRAITQIDLAERNLEQFGEGVLARRAIDRAKRNLEQHGDGAS